MDILEQNLAVTKMVTAKIVQKISKSNITSENVYASPSDVSLSTIEDIQKKLTIFSCCVFLPFGR